MAMITADGVLRERFGKGGHLFCWGSGTQPHIDSESGYLFILPATRVRLWGTPDIFELPVQRGDGSWSRTAITDRERRGLVERGWISPEIEPAEPERLYLTDDDVATEIAVNLAEGLDAIQRQVVIDAIERGVLQIAEADQDGEADMRLRAVLEALREIGATL
jgi:hypothetical protein